MTQESSIMTNLKAAQDLQKAGFKTKVHAIQRCSVCGTNHKAEIDSMIAQRLGEAYICSWLKSEYPACEEAKVFPSTLALSRYTLRFYQKSEERKELERGIKDKFDPLMEGLSIYNITKSRLAVAMAIEREGGVPTIMVSDLLKQKKDAWESLLKAMVEMHDSQKGSVGVTNIFNNNDNRSIHNTTISGDDKKTILEIARESGLFADITEVPQSEGRSTGLVEGDEQGRLG